MSIKSTSKNLNLPQNTYYKRNLPESCIPFDSSKGKELFRLALDENNLETYFSLSMQFLTQSEPAYCGLGTLCMVLNAFGIDPYRKWKGVWRWWDESMLDCCRDLDHVRQNGISIPEFACLARCNRLKANVYHADQVSKDDFVRHVRDVSRNTSEVLVVSYHRESLNQTGTGHFSPIGGGYIILSQSKSGYTQSAISQLSFNKDSWPELYNVLFIKLPKTLIADSAPRNHEELLSRIISFIPDEYHAVVDYRLAHFPTHDNNENEHEGIGCDRCSESSTTECNQYIRGLRNLLDQLRITELNKIISTSVEVRKKSQIYSETLEKSKDNTETSFNDLFTIFMFALFTFKPSLYECLDNSDLVQEMRRIVSLDEEMFGLIRDEVLFLRDQMAALTELVDGESTA